MPMNIALVGSNFALRGYLPAIEKINDYKIKIICSRNIKNFKLDNNINLVSDWRKIFNKKIDIIILAVPPGVQEKILTYNLKYKKKIIFEKPITQNYFKSKKIVELIKKKKIKSSINLTYINHELFQKLKTLIKNQTLGKVKNYNVVWSFNNYDYNNKIKTWKTDEKKGGGIKNIFLTHVLSYCEFFFGANKINSVKIKYSRFKNLNYKKFISFNISNPNNINGKILLYNKKSGYQNHRITIKFQKGHIQLFTKSRDWTKDFVLKIQNINKNKAIKIMANNNFKDGRSKQIYNMLRDFVKVQDYTKIDYCLNAEKIISKIN